MGPETNSELFQAFAVPRIEAINEAFDRRNMAAGTMRELDEQLNEKETTADPVTEPTLYTRLYVLSHVQRTQVGLDGLTPLSAVDFREGSSVKAKQAPHHEEYVTPDGIAYRTRAIRLELSTDRTSRDISIFGLNIYRPDIDFDSLADNSGDNSSSGIILVDDKANVKRKEQAITGETVVFAAINKRSGDVKLYTVSPEPANEYSENKPPITHDPANPNRILVATPDGQYYAVEQLGGKLLFQALDEFNKALAKVKGATSLNDTLGENEREALQDVIAGENS